MRTKKDVPRKHEPWRRGPGRPCTADNVISADDYTFEKVSHAKATVRDRVLWLLFKVSGGNRRAFAASTGISHTAVIKIANGQEPGRRVLTKIVQRYSDVDANWLLTGVTNGAEHPCLSAVLQADMDLRKRTSNQLLDLLVGVVTEIRRRGLVIGDLDAAIT